MLIFCPGRAIDEQARGLHIGGHIRQGCLYHLEISDALAELAAFSGISDTGIQTRLSHTDGTGSNSQAATIQGGHSDFETLAGSAQQCTFWHAAFF